MKALWIVTATAIGLTASTWAQAPGGLGRRGPADVSQYNLEPQQAVQVQERQFAHRQKMIELQATSQQAQLEVRRLLAADTADEAAVMKAVERSGDALTQIQKERTRHFLELRNIVGVEKATAMTGDFMRGGPQNRMDRPAREGYRAGDQPDRRPERPERRPRGGAPAPDASVDMGE